MNARPEISWVTCGLTLAALGLACRARAQDASYFNGNVDISQLEMENSQGSTSILMQKYALSWRHSLTPYLSADAGVLYSHLGQDYNDARSYQSDLQPMGDANWNTPWFSFGAHGDRHESENSYGEANLTRDNGSFNFKTKPDLWPMLNLGLDLDHLYNPDRPDLRNIREYQASAGLNWEHKTQSLSYGFNRDQTDNLTASTVDGRNSQVFRWDQTSDWFDHKLRLRSEYSASYRTERFLKPDSVPVLEWVPVEKAYYAIDPSPQFSVLDSVNGLMDGNKGAPVSPQILVGPQNLDVNIAVDIGDVKQVGAVYLYAARKALSPGVWTVYTSNARFFGDDMQWDPLPEQITDRFDEGYLRFEITFPDTATRFLKVVFNGTSDTGKVDITELEVLHHVTGKSGDLQRNSTQIASLNTTYRFNDDYNLSLDLGFQNEPLASADVKKKVKSTPPCPAAKASIPS